MKAKKRKKRILLGLDAADLREAKANAKALGLSVNEYIRRRVNGRPLKAVKLRYKSQDDTAELIEGRIAAFEAAMGRRPSSEQEFLDWFLDQEVSDEMDAALAESDKRMATLDADKARWIKNREQERSRMGVLAPSLPEASR